MQKKKYLHFLSHLLNANHTRLAHYLRSVFIKKCTTKYNKEQYLFTLRKPQLFNKSFKFLIVDIPV